MLQPATYHVVVDTTKDAQPDNLVRARLDASVLRFVGVVMWFQRRHLPSLFRIIFPVGFTLGGLLCLAGLVFRHPLQPSELAAAFRAGKCSVVEGTVTDFHAMPANGHGIESFLVGGKRFQYSDYIITSGFHQTTSHGGPVRDGLRLRIHYLGSNIAKL